MAANEEQIADLLKEIAAKHHLSIGRDDPILVLHTINRRLLENSAKAQQEQLEGFQSQIESISQRWSQDAKTKADRALSAAINAASESALEVLQVSTSSAVSAIRTEIKTGNQRLSQLVRRTETAAYTNLAAALLTLFAIAIVVAGFWHHG